MTRSRWALALVVTYAFTLAAAFVYTYLPRYFVSVGWTSAAVGLLFAFGQVVRVIAMPSWARIAERSSSTTAVVRAVCTLGVVTLWALPFVESPFLVFLLFAAMYGTWNAFLPLTDSLTVRQLGSHSFGRVRAFGSAGFGLAALGIAIAGAAQTHEAVAGWSVWLLAIAGTVAAISTWFYPNDEVAIRAPDLPHALRLLGRPALIVCFPLWALHWASQAPYNLFLVFLAEYRGMAGWVPGVAVAFGVVSEIVVLAVGRRVVDRVGPEVAFAATALISAARWAGCAVITNTAALVLLQVLHGVTFGVFLLSAMAVLDREVRTEVRDSGQAIFYVVVFGAGSALGNSLSGWLDDAFGAPTAFGAAAGLEVCVAAAAILYATSVVRRLTDER